MQIKLIEYIIIYFYHQFRIVLFEKFMKYANYANYLIKYAFYRETPGLIEFYRKNYI